MSVDIFIISSDINFHLPGFHYSYHTPYLILNNHFFYLVSLFQNNSFCLVSFSLMKDNSKLKKIGIFFAYELLLGQILVLCLNFLSLEKCKEKCKHYFYFVLLKSYAETFFLICLVLLSFKR